ncbi:MAG: hypothetical protein U1G07_02055 [Verrucomicrobiota bacterium]
MREVKLDDQGEILQMNPFLSTFIFRSPIDMKIGPDGAIYIIEWAGGTVAAQVDRVDYVTGLPAPAIVLFSTPSLQAPFAVDASGQITPGTSAIAVPLPSSTRFYRLQSPTAVRITTLQVANGQLQLHYESVADPN